MPTKYNKYYTGYIPFPYQIEKPLPYVGKYFNIEFGKPHPMRNCDYEYELVILTKDIRNALNTSNLIYAAIDLLNGEGPFYSENHPIIIPAIKEKNYDSKWQLGSILEHCGDIPRAAKIASKCSFRKYMVYALLKYQLGCNLFPSSIMDIDSPEYKPLYYYRIQDQIKLGYAIIAFYSVLEELGLEIRASSKNPSMINGKWNPKVKDELEDRLTKNGIDINELFDWNLRNTPTKIEKRKKPDLLKKSPWAFLTRRDSQINITDAIVTISWIRSKIAAHRLNDAITSISIYDASNASLLARRLLLERLGYWKNSYPNDEKIATTA
jgi:hypothetical protein